MSSTGTITILPISNWVDRIIWVYSKNGLERARCLGQVQIEEKKSDDVSSSLCFSVLVRIREWTLVSSLRQVLFYNFMPVPTLATSTSTPVQQQQQQQAFELLLAKFRSLRHEDGLYEQPYYQCSILEQRFVKTSASTSTSTSTIGSRLFSSFDLRTPFQCTGKLFLQERRKPSNGDNRDHPVHPSIQYHHWSNIERLLNEKKERKESDDHVSTFHVFTELANAKTLVYVPLFKLMEMNPFLPSWTYHLQSFLNLWSLVHDSTKRSHSDDFKTSLDWAHQFRHSTRNKEGWTVPLGIRIGEWYFKTFPISVQEYRWRYEQSRSSTLSCSDEKQGRRTSMEDVMLQVVDEESGYQLCAVCDGHDGRHIVEAIIGQDPRIPSLDRHLFAVIHRYKSQLSEDHVAWSMLFQQAFIEYDRLLYDLYQNVNHSKGGSTFTGFILPPSGSYLWVINLGDSRLAMFSREEKGLSSSSSSSSSSVSSSSSSIHHIFSTQDHKPALLAEKERIEEAGGFIEFAEGCARVQGYLALSRAFGDFHLKKSQWNSTYDPVDGYVCAWPNVHCIQLHSTTTFWIMIACDGVWDVWQEEELGPVILKYGSLVHIPQFCRDINLQSIDERGSSDNVSIGLYQLAPNISSVFFEEKENVDSSRSLSFPFSSLTLSPRSSSSSSSGSSCMSSSSSFILPKMQTPRGFVPNFDPCFYPYSSSSTASLFSSSSASLTSLSSSLSMLSSSSSLESSSAERYSRSVSNGLHPAFQIFKDINKAQTQARTLANAPCSLSSSLSSSSTSSFSSSVPRGERKQKKMDYAQRLPLDHIFQLDTKDEAGNRVSLDEQCGIVTKEEMIERAKQREQLIESLLAKNGGPFSSENFPLSELTDQALKKIVEKADEIFLHGILHRLQQVRNYKIRYRVINNTHEDWAAVAEEEDGRTGVYLTLNRHCFTQVDWKNPNHDIVFDNGIQCRHLLEHVVVTVIHEMIHILFYTRTSTDVGHEKAFKCFSRYLLGLSGRNPFYWIIPQKDLAKFGMSMDQIDLSSIDVSCYASSRGTCGHSYKIKPSSS